MTLIAIGGAEDKTGPMAILRRLVAETGLENPRVLVITSASEYPSEAEARYAAAFARLGVSCDFAHISSATEAAAPSAVNAAINADAFFFSGGDQSRLVSILAETPFMAAVRARYDAGAVIAGTSAGAAAMSSLMVCGGDPARGMIKGEVAQGAGFGLAEKIVFDTHFSERNRLPRLFNAIAAHPGKTGIGLDEDTALVLRGDRAEVEGSGAVTVVTGDALRSNIAEIAEGEAVRAQGFTVSIYRAGDSFRI